MLSSFAGECGMPEVELSESAMRETFPAVQCRKRFLDTVLFLLEIIRKGLDRKYGSCWSAVSAILSECNDRTSDPYVVSGPSDCNGIAIVSESYPMCFKVGTSWVHNTSLTIPEVPSVEECQSLCLQSSECIAFTWHKESAAFGSKVCELFPTTKFHC